MPIVPKGVIIHSMAEYLKMDNGPVKAHDFLKSVRLSVHGFIHPDGTYENMTKSPGKAFHAGTSEWNGLKHLNSHYLGFELLVPGEHDYGSFLKAINKPGTYTQAQFDCAVKVCRYWIKLYNIPIDNIVRHSDCSGDHVRGKGKGKSDPGAAFDWESFKIALK